MMYQQVGVSESAVAEDNDVRAICAFAGIDVPTNV